MRLGKKIGAGVVATVSESQRRAARAYRELLLRCASRSVVAEDKRRLRAMIRVLGRSETDVQHDLSIVKRQAVLEASGSLVAKLQNGHDAVKASLDRVECKGAARRSLAKTLASFAKLLRQARSTSKRVEKFQSEWESLLWGVVRRPEDSRDRRR